jgi:hypothetical protein
MPPHIVSPQQPDQSAMRVCGHCEVEDPRLHPVRLERRTGAIVELMVCRYCYLQLTGIAPSTARRATRPER